MSSLNNLINTVMPDEIYNLAAQSHVAVFQKSTYTTQTVCWPLTILEAVKNSDKNKVLSSFFMKCWRHESML